MTLTLVIDATRSYYAAIETLDSMKRRAAWETAYEYEYGSMVGQVCHGHHVAIDRLYHRDVTEAMQRRSPASEMARST
jgi:hypothetical protein